jgi:cell division protein FtsB
MLVCLLISGYFAQHAMFGKHGLEARARLQTRAASVNLEVKKLDAELRLLQRDVALLSAEPPDADFVREIATDVLGFVPTDGLLVMGAGQAPPKR